MERSFAVSTDAPRQARRFVDEVLAQVPAGAGSADGVADDLRLAVSELVSNAVEHGGRGPVVVSLDRDGAGWTLCVTAPAAGPFDVQMHAPDTDRPRGRGLAIVASVTDDVEVEQRDGVVVVRCHRRFS